MIILKDWCILKRKNTFRTTTDLSWNAIIWKTQLKIFLFSIKNSPGFPVHHSRWHDTVAVVLLSNGTKGTRELKQSIIIIFFCIRSPAYCFLLAWLTSWALRSLLLIYICPGLKIKQYCSYSNFFQTKLSSTMIYYHSPYRMFLGTDCFLQCLAETSLVFSSMQNMHLLISLLNSENNFDP